MIIEQDTDCGGYDVNPAEYLDDVSAYADEVDYRQFHTTGAYCPPCVVNRHDGCHDND